MSRTYLLAIVTLLAAVFASVVTASEKPESIEGWGAVVDPAADCEFLEDDGKLTITIPAKHHDLNPSPKFDNVLAPRVLQDVEGDFVAKVKLAARAPVNAPAKVKVGVAAINSTTNESKPQFEEFMLQEKDK